MRPLKMRQRNACASVLVSILWTFGATGSLHIALTMWLGCQNGEMDLCKGWLQLPERESACVPHRVLGYRGEESAIDDSHETRGGQMPKCAERRGLLNPHFPRLFTRAIHVAPAWSAIQCLLRALARRARGGPRRSGTGRPLYCYAGRLTGPHFPTREAHERAPWGVPGR